MRSYPLREFEITFLWQASDTIMVAGKAAPRAFALGGVILSTPRRMDQDQTTQDFVTFSLDQIATG
jgi:hypothetical protein